MRRDRQEHNGITLRRHSGDNEDLGGPSGIKYKDCREPGRHEKRRVWGYLRTERPQNGSHSHAKRRLSDSPASPATQPGSEEERGGGCDFLRTKIFNTRTVVVFCAVSLQMEGFFRVRTSGPRAITFQVGIDTRGWVSYQFKKEILNSMQNWRTRCGRISMDRVDGFLNWCRFDF